MIYLLRSPAWDKKRGYFQLLKIGWIDDTKSWIPSRVKNRKRTYKSHNPTCEVLLEIPGLSIDVEEGLHDYFSTHRYQSMKEWYEFVPEIINFFSSPDLTKQLQEMGEKGKVLRENREWKKKQVVYNYLLWRCSVNNPLKTNSEKEWLEKISSLLPPEEFIIMERDLDVLSTMPNEGKEILQKVATLKSIDKRIEVLKEAVLELDEFVYDWVLRFIDKQTKEKI